MPALANSFLPRCYSCLPCQKLVFSPSFLLLPVLTQLFLLCVTNRVKKTLLCYSCLLCKKPVKSACTGQPLFSLVVIPAYQVITCLPSRFYPQYKLVFPRCYSCLPCTNFDYFNRGTWRFFIMLYQIDSLRMYMYIFTYRVIHNPCKIAVITDRARNVYVVFVVNCFLMHYQKVIFESSFLKEIHQDLSRYNKENSSQF